MIINSITLDNFKSHKHSHINLNKGISLILGENGAGKSSIFEAMSYAFYNKFDGKADEIIRKPANDNDVINEMNVTVEFENNGIHYIVKRGRKNNQSKVKLYTIENDKPVMLCSGNQLVNREIETIFKLDQKSFFNAVYIRQGEITELIDKTPAEKKELIAKLLNIDDLEKSWEEIKNIIDKYKTQISKNEGMLTRKKELEDNTCDLEKDLEKNCEHLKVIKPELERINNEVRDYEVKITKSDSDKNEFTTLNNQAQQLNEFINDYKKQESKITNQLKNIEKCESECKEIEKYVKQLPHLQELKEYKNQLDKYKEQLEHVTKNINRINNYKKSLEENQKYYEEYESTNAKIESLSQERTQLEEKVKSNVETVTKLNDKKSKKEKNLIFIRKTSEHASKIFKENFSSPEEVENKVIEVKEKNEKYIEVLDDKIKENDKRISVLKNDLNNYRKSLKELENTEDTCPICQSPISHDKHLELSEKYNAEINKIEYDIDNLNESNENQRKKMKEHEKILEDIECIKLGKLKDRYDEFNELSGEIKELEKKIPQIEEDKTSLEKLDSEINEKRNYLKSIEDKRNNYITAQKNLEESDIEKEINEQEEINIKFNEIKNKSREIMIRYKVGDDLERTIKYAQEQERKYNENQGIIQNKESQINEKAEVINKINDKNENLKNIKDKLNNLNYDDEENKKLHETHTSLQNKREKTQEDLTTLNVKIENLKKQIKQNNNELEKLEKIKAEQENLKDYVKLLEDIRDVYSKDGIQKELREDARPDIEKNTLDIFNEFDFDYTSIQLDENYEITVQLNNETLGLKMMSGGEKIVIALALRLGIARVVAKNRTELLLLDEPTIHLDSEKRDSLIDIIRQINIVPQMIVVTHDDGMEAISNNIIKIRKEHGISYIDDS